jgi:hypothetical protein
MIGSQRPFFTQSVSIDRGLHPDESNASMSTPKTIVSPSSVSIYIESPPKETPKSNNQTINDQQACYENGTTGDTGEDVIILKRSSTYTDDDSELENDKTPLINCNSLGEKTTVHTHVTTTTTMVTVKIKSAAASDNNELQKKEETKM